MEKKLVLCPCCESSESQALYRKKEHPHILQGLPVETIIMKCDNCAAAYTEPMPTQEQLEYIYREEFLYPDHFSKQEKKGLIKYINQLENLLGQKSGKMLDIGCASGLLLSLAVAKGWQAYGLDTSQKLLEVAMKEVPQASLFLGPIKNADYDSNYFDIAVALNLLEHLTDPIDFLKEVNRVLRPGGLFLFKTVRIDSILARKRKMDWDHLKWPGHLIWYSKKSLQRLLQNTNFHIRKIQFTGVPYIPGVRRYMDHRMYGGEKDKNTQHKINHNQIENTMSITKKVMKIMLKNDLLKTIASNINNTFQLGDTITIIAEKNIQLIIELIRILNYHDRFF